MTCDMFDLEAPNLAQIYILGNFCFGLYMGLVDRDLQGYLGLKRINAHQNELVRTITCDILDIESPNLAHICTLGSFAWDCIGGQWTVTFKVIWDSNSRVFHTIGGALIRNMRVC